MDNSKWTYQPWPDAPAEDVIDIDVAESDQTLEEPCRGIWVYTSGDLVITTLRGEIRTIPAAALVVGMIYPICATVIMEETEMTGAVLI